MGTYASGASIGLSWSTAIDQSMRSRLFHCRVLPFSYRLRSLSRPSSYSHVKMVSAPLPTFHRVCSTGRAYTRVLIGVLLSGCAHGVRGEVEPALHLTAHGALMQQGEEAVGQRQAAVDEVAQRGGIVVATTSSVKWHLMPCAPLPHLTPPATRRRRRSPPAAASAGRRPARGGCPRSWCSRRGRAAPASPAAAAPAAPRCSPRSSPGRRPRTSCPGRRRTACRR